MFSRRPLQTCSLRAHQHVWLRLEGHLGMKVSVMPLAPKLIHMLHDFEKTSDLTVAVADAFMHKCLVHKLC